MAGVLIEALYRTGPPPRAVPLYTQPAALIVSSKHRRMGSKDE